MKRCTIGSVLIVLALLMITLMMVCFVGCAVPSKAIVQTRDTLYVERIVDRQSIIRDTVETSSMRVEYLIDSLGDWCPQKMVEEVVVQRHTQKIGDEEIVKEETFAKTEVTAEEFANKTSKWKWFLYGIVASMILVVVLLLRR